MTKKLTKHGNELALIIDKPLLDNLGITEKTELDVAVIGEMLLIKPKTTDTDFHKKKREATRKLATSIMDRYEEVFKKLAKT